jgi:hypothetical protein
MEVEEVIVPFPPGLLQIILPVRESAAGLIQVDTSTVLLVEAQVLASVPMT